MVSNGFFQSDKKNTDLSKIPIEKPATPEAQRWDGWGTALKPAVEFFTLCRKPLAEKTVAENVMEWGAGGINVDGCRVATDEKLGRIATKQIAKTSC